MTQRQHSPETYEEKVAQLQELREAAIHSSPEAEAKQHENNYSNSILHKLFRMSVSRIFGKRVKRGKTLLTARFNPVATPTRGRQGCGNASAARSRPHRVRY